MLNPETVRLVLAPETSCCLWLSVLARTKLLSIYLLNCYKKVVQLRQPWHETSASSCPSSFEQHIKHTLLSGDSRDEQEERGSQPHSS